MISKASSAVSFSTFAANADDSVTATATSPTGGRQVSHGGANEASFEDILRGTGEAETEEDDPGIGDEEDEDESTKTPRPTLPYPMPPSAVDASMPPAARVSLLAAPADNDVDDFAIENDAPAFPTMPVEMPADRRAVFGMEPRVGSAVMPRAARMADDASSFVTDAGAGTGIATGPGGRTEATRTGFAGARLRNTSAEYPAVRAVRAAEEENAVEPFGVSDSFAPTTFGSIPTGQLAGNAKNEVAVRATLAELPAPPGKSPIVLTPPSPPARVTREIKKTTLPEPKFTVPGAPPAAVPHAKLGVSMKTKDASNDEAPIGEKAKATATATTITMADAGDGRPTLRVAAPYASAKSEADRFQQEEAAKTVEREESAITTATKPEASMFRGRYEIVDAPTAGDGRMTITDGRSADPHAEAARMATRTKLENAAVRTSVGRALKQGAKTEVHLPEAGRISVSAETRPTKVDVSLDVERTSTARTLASHAGELASELRSPHASARVTVHGPGVSAGPNGDQRSAAERDPRREPEDTQEEKNPVRTVASRRVRIVL